MWIRREAFLVLTGHEVDASCAEVGLADRRQRLEHRAGERAMQLARDLGGRLLADLPGDDLGLRFERGDGPVLEVQHQPGRANRSHDREHHGPCVPERCG